MSNMKPTGNRDLGLSAFARRVSGFGPRLFVAIALAIISGAILHASANLLFHRLSNPPVQSAPVLAMAAEAVHLVEAAPPLWRPTMVKAASNSDFEVRWFERDHPPTLGVRMNDQPGPPRAVAAALARLGVPIARLYGSDKQAPHGGVYQLQVQLADTSWLTFTVTHQLWGVSSLHRFLLTASTFLVAALIVAAIFGHMLSAPVRRFTRAIEQFSPDADMPPLRLAGPWEVQSAVRVINAMHERIRAFVAQRAVLLAAITHDLRAPLTRLRLRTELMEESPTQDLLLQDIDAMSTMIVDALALLRHHHGDQDSVETVDMNELVRNVLQDTISTSGKRPWSLSMEAGLQARGSPPALRRALGNVIDNALRYGGGAFVTLSATDSAIEIKVCDNGPGLAPDALEAVFQPFRRGSTASPYDQGAGLGLTSARSIVTQHSGSIIATNRPSGGLCVLLTLPRVGHISTGELRIEDIAAAADCLDARKAAGIEQL
jgi:signal transduction histidine kinase